MARKESFEARLKRSRYSNTKGSVIPMHHAFRRMRFTPSAKFMSFIGGPVIAFILWWTFPQIANFWGQMFTFWMDKIGYNPAIASVRVELMLKEFTLHYPALDSYLPTSGMVWLNLFATIILFALSLFFPGRSMPVTYLIRAAILIQASASVFFIISPEWFPYHLPSYSVNCILLSMCLLVVTPLLLCCVYYIFDFPMYQKIFLTTLMLGFFLVALPMQYLVHAYIIHHLSYLFMPLVYFLFGVLPDVLMFICFFSWGMSWRGDDAYALKQKVA